MQDQALGAIPIAGELHKSASTRAVGQSDSSQNRLGLPQPAGSFVRSRPGWTCLILQQVLPSPESTFLPTISLFACWSTNFPCAGVSADIAEACVAQLVCDGVPRLIVRISVWIDTSATDNRFFPGNFFVMVIGVFVPQSVRRNAKLIAFDSHV